MRISDWSSDVCSSDLFVRPAIATEYLDSKLPSYRVYYPATEGLENSLIKMVADFGLAAPFADLPADARTLARMALRQLRRLLPRGAGQDRKSTRLNSSH